MQRLSFAILLIALNLACAPTFASVSEEGSCLTMQGSPIGTLLAKCSRVVQSRTSDSLFEIQTMNACVSQMTRSVGESSSEIITYIGQDWQGRYTGTVTSSDHLLPGAFGEPSYQPNQSAEYGVASEYYSLPDGSPTQLYGSGASIINGVISVDTTAQDGINQNYFNYRTKAVFNSASKELAIQYWRENSSGLWGIGAEWVKLYDVVLSCDR